jgi:hypothetical protein
LAAGEDDPCVHVICDAEASEHCRMFKCHTDRDICHISGHVLKRLDGIVPAWGYVASARQQAVHSSLQLAVLGIDLDRLYVTLG